MTGSCWFNFHNIFFVLLGFIQGIWWEAWYYDPERCCHVSNHCQWGSVWSLHLFPGKKMSLLTISFVMFCFNCFLYYQCRCSPKNISPCFWLATSFSWASWLWPTCWALLYPKWSHLLFQIFLSISCSLKENHQKRNYSTTSSHLTIWSAWPFALESAFGTCWKRYWCLPISDGFFITNIQLIVPFLALDCQQLAWICFRRQRYWTFALEQRRHRLHSFGRSLLLRHLLGFWYQCHGYRCQVFWSSD